MELFNGKYQKECLLGRGAFSEVWKVIDIQTGVVQALKIYSPSTAMEDDGIVMMKHEFALMANASHQNLLRPLYFDICNQRPFLVLSYCKNGNIKKKVGHFSEAEAWKLLKDAASGLAYLHEMEPPVIHQDIKPENILIADNGSYMLTDFGVSTKAKSNMSQISNEDRTFQSAGTFPYMPPEKFSKNNLPILASDIWSLGVTVYEMLMGELPFGNEGGLRQKIGADIPEIQGDYSLDLRDILVKCMAKEPWERPKAEELEKTALSFLTYTPTISINTPDKKTDVASSDALLPIEPRDIKEDVKEENTEKVEEVEEELSGQSVKPKKKYIIAAVLIGLLVLAITGYLFIPSQPDSQAQPALPAADNGKVDANADSIPGKELEVQDTSMNTVQEPVQVPTIKPTPNSDPDKKKDETKNHNSKNEKGTDTDEKVKFNVSQKGNLRYGSWSGKVSGGKPIGFGTLTFTSSATISCSNGVSINAQAGDKINNAEFDDDGHLYQGTWIKADGTKKTIMP